MSKELKNIFKKMRKAILSVKFFMGILCLQLCLIDANVAFSEGPETTRMGDRINALKSNEDKQNAIEAEQKKKAVRIVNSSNYKQAIKVIEQCAPEKAEKIKDYMEELLGLSTQTKREWTLDWRGVNHYSPEGRQKEITEELKKAYQYRSSVEDDPCGRRLDIAIANVANEAKTITEMIRSRWGENKVEKIDADRYELNKEESKKKVEEETKEKLAKAEENAKLTECPFVGDVKAKYSAGCWTCLVVEKITSAFLHAANKGLKVTQKAGVVLLIIGSAIWLAMWALKNVSSFTEIQLGNILNDLIKFLFKVAIAYWFIFYSQTAISKYFINPIMSVGALVGQQFWDERIEQYTEEYEDITEEDQAAMEEFVTRKDAVGVTPIPGETTEATESNITLQELSSEEIAEDKIAENKNNKNFTKSAIPNLLIPGVKGGCISSGAGCRPKSAGGSLCHQGVDVGCVADAMKTCVQYVASGPGVVQYEDMGGYGHVAKVVHGRVGKYEWVTTYNHMNGPLTNQLKQVRGLRNGTTVKQGDPIGCAGRSGGSRGNIRENAYAQHIHFEVFAGGKRVDPLALAAKQIVFIDSICGQFITSGKPRKTEHCNGSNRITSSAAESFLGCKSQTNQWTCRKNVPPTGWPAAGEAIISLNSSEVGVSAGEISALSFSGDYSNVIVQIPEVKYTGPTNIMSKSVMNSILGATRAITDTTAEIQVLGDVTMCYATMDNGGAWKEEITGIHIPNIPMWLSGFIMLCLGFLLTMTIGYYLVDISFKIGFAVLALPIVMGLWPFEITSKKLFSVIKIIAKASATFAFLAMMTAFGMSLVDSALNQGGIEELYSAIDFLINPSNTNQEASDNMREYIAQELQISSTKFILIGFSIWYFFKLIQGTSSDLVNKFFPDDVFGDSSPMHSAATMMTSFIKGQAMKPVGLVRDIAVNQAGNIAKRGLKSGAGRIKSGTKAVGRAVKSGFNKLRGKGDAS